MSGDRNDAEIFKLLRDHESHIASLQTDVSGIKGAVHQQGVILQEIRSTLAEQKAGRGPGLMQVLGGAALCCGVFGAASAAITVLVASQFSPTISEIKTSLGAVSSVVQRIDTEKTHRDAEELKALRADKDRRLIDTDRTLADRLRILED